MNGLVGTRGTTPADLLKVTKVHLVDDAHIEEALLNFTFDGADVRVLLRATEVGPIVAYDHGDAALGR